MDPPSGPALQVLAVLLAITIVSMLAATLLPALAYLTGSSSTVALDAELEPPLVVAQSQNRWEMDSMQTSATIAEPESVGGLDGFTPQTVHGRILVDRDDGAGAPIYRTGLTAIGVLGLVALIALRRIVVSARDGEPFAAANIRRLRLAGACALAVPVVSEATERSLIRVVEVGTAIELQPTLLPWWPFVLLAAASFALAEIFRRGAELHDFEQLAV